METALEIVEFVAAFVRALDFERLALIAIIVGHCVVALALYVVAIALKRDSR